MEARLGGGRDAVAEVCVHALPVAGAVVAVAVEALRRSGDEVVPRTGCTARARLAPAMAEAAHVDASVERRGVAPGRTDEVDRAAERVAAVAQRIGPAEDFDVAKGGRIDLEEIEEPVRRVDGDTVHAEVDAPVAVVSRQAGAPDREPRVRAPARLRHHA